MICDICQRDLTNEEISVNEDEHLYCVECLSFPFSQLNNNELYYEVNSKYNIEALIDTNNFRNPFWLQNDFGIHTDHDVDPDTNCLIKRISGVKCQYYTEESFNSALQNEQVNSDELSLLHINIRSIRNKFDELSDYLASLKINFSIIELTETWLTENYANMFNISYYNLLTANRKSKSGGGVGMCIKEQTNFRLREDLSVFNEGVSETLFIELKNNKKESAVVGVIYRPPKSKMKEFEDELEALISKIIKENKLIYLMGDINIDMLKMNQVSSVGKYMYQLFSSSLYPLITKPSRIMDKSATLIDNLSTNSLDDSNMNGILITDISDHFPVFTIKRNTMVNNAQRVTQVRQITPDNIDNLMDGL